MEDQILNATNAIIDILKDSDIETKVQYLNLVREKLHEHSPFKNEPVDFVRWVKNDQVIAND